MKQYITDNIAQHIDTISEIAETPEIIGAIQAAAKLIIASLHGGGKIMLAGNGGSAADAQHIAAEFINRFNMRREALPAIALTTDTSVLTSIANDRVFDKIFSRQIEALGTPADTFIAFTTSGNSVNIIEALAECRRRGITTIALAGAKCLNVAQYCDAIIPVPSYKTPRIQEAHIMISHILCGIIERELCTEQPEPQIVI
ncbi:MAG: SIS domain-containing protein [Bacteroidales bacterium]|jgi:D-sedoheptulose 7-phosphate isomerase|nr:SIS domain-containing protein [Bacteroidales bacterium]